MLARKERPFPDLDAFEGMMGQFATGTQARDMRMMFRAFHKYGMAPEPVTHSILASVLGGSSRRYTYFRTGDAATFATIRADLGKVDALLFNAGSGVFADPRYLGKIACPIEGISLCARQRHCSSSGMAAAMPAS
jgi:hypothetical protein